MNGQADAIVDQQPSYPPAPVPAPVPVVIDRPTDDLVAFVAACEQLRRRVQADEQAELDRACAQLAAQLARQGRRLARGPLVEAARWQLVWARRRAADAELRSMHPTSQLIADADAHDDAELYRRREPALALLLDDDATSYTRHSPQVLADREQACRQQAVLVDEQTQATGQLARLRGLRGLLAHRRVRQLNRELGELDRQLGQVQDQLAGQQALLDAIDTREADRAAWLAPHRPVLEVGAAAVVVLHRRRLALANPPGCPRPLSTVDLDHPMGHDPLDPSAPGGPTTNVNVPEMLKMWHVLAPSAPGGPTSSGGGTPTGTGDGGTSPTTTNGGTPAAPPATALSPPATPTVPALVPGPAATVTAAPGSGSGRPAGPAAPAGPG